MFVVFLSKFSYAWSKLFIYFRLSSEKNTFTYLRKDKNQKTFCVNRHSEYLHGNLMDNPN